MNDDKKYLLLTTCWLVFAWLFAYRGILIAMLPSMVSSLSLTNTMVGSLVGVLWTSDALGSYPAGVATAFLDRRKLLALSLALSAVFMLVFISFQVFPAMLVSLFFAGLGFGSYYPIGVSLLSEKFRGRRLGTVLGLHETGVPIGSTVGPLIASLLLSIQLDWRSILALGLIAVPVMIFLLSQTIRSEMPLQTSKGIGFKISSWKTYALIITFAICVIGLDTGLTSMIPIYMVDVLHVSNSESALVYGATRVFGILGIVTSGYLSDRISRSTILVGAVSLATLASIAIALLPYNSLFIIALAVLAAASSSYWPVLMTIMSGITSNDDLPRVIGFQRLFNGLLGGGLTPVAIGLLADTFGFRTALAYPISLGAVGLVAAVSLKMNASKR
jgi:MFS family permease